MLTEDNLFEVVFDPGSDKREKWIPGPVFSIGEDTGGVRLAKTRSESPTQLFQSIGRCLSGQTFCVARIPIAKSLRCGYAYIWQSHDAVCFGQIGHGVNLFTARETKDRAANQKKRHIGAYFGC